MLGLWSSVRIALKACYRKFFLLHYTQILYQSRLCKADHAYLTYVMLQRQLSHLNGRKLTATKFKPLIFSMSGFALSFTANKFILMILYDFCLLSSKLCYIIVYIGKVGSRVQIADRCAPWKISSGAENLVLYALQF
jgi:hypothetical protein